LLLVVVGVQQGVTTGVTVDVGGRINLEVRVLKGMKMKRREPYLYSGSVANWGLDNQG
jgi:hypothetical protein